MCNYVHAESRMLKPNNEGYAYKIFTKFPAKDELSSMVFSIDYVADRSGWIKWDTKYSGHGFCVFLTEDDALRVVENWTNSFKWPLYLIVKRVKYREMICTHKEQILIWRIQRQRLDW